MALAHLKMRSLNPSWKNWCERLLNIYEINAICFNVSNYDRAREKPCTACNFSKWEIVALQYLLFSFPPVWSLVSRSQPPQSVPRDSKQQVQPKTASCWTLCNVVGLLTLFLFPRIFCHVCTWNSLTLLPFWHLGPLFFLLLSNPCCQMGCSVV